MQSLSLQLSKLLRRDGKFQRVSVSNRPVFIWEGVVFEEEAFQLLEIHGVRYLGVAGLGQRFYGHLDWRVVVVSDYLIGDVAALAFIVAACANKSFIGQRVIGSFGDIGVGGKQAKN